jgi:hypothetical protein
MRFRRARPFADLVDRQLSLFGAQRSDLLDACTEALTAYREAGRDDAEERYGDYVDAVEEAREALEEMRDSYTATLDGEAARTYRESFDRAARRRFPGLDVGLE